MNPLNDPWVRKAIKDNKWNPKKVKVFSGQEAVDMLKERTNIKKLKQRHEDTTP